MSSLFPAIPGPDKGFVGQHFGAQVIRGHLCSVAPSGWRVRGPKGAVLAEGPERGAAGFALALAALERHSS